MVGLVVPALGQALASAVLLLNGFLRNNAEKGELRSKGAVTRALFYLLFTYLVSVAETGEGEPDQLPVHKGYNEVGRTPDIVLDGEREQLPAEKDAFHQAGHT